MIFFVGLPALALYTFAMYRAYITDNFFALGGWACAFVAMSMFLFESVKNDEGR